MTVKELAIPGVLLLEPTVHEDERGYFIETYQRERFREWGIDCEFVQDNHSFSKQAGTIRGLHFQLPPMAQTKLVQVTQGAIFDVVVDLRRGSETFGRWVTADLTAQNHRQLLVPKGFAHGFCTLMDNTYVTYKVDQYYSKECERGIAWDDPTLGIDWPAVRPILSDKDRGFPTLKPSLCLFD